MRPSHIIAALATTALCGIGTAETTTSIATGLAYPAMAQSNEAVTDDFDDKLYFTTDVGLNFMPDVKLDDVSLSGFLRNQAGVTTFNSGVLSDLKYRTDLGVRWDIGIGYEFTENFRVQIESGYLHNKVSNLSGTAVVNAPFFNLSGTASGNVTRELGVSYDGSISQVPIMAAAIYEFNLGSGDRTDKSAMAGWRFRPYAGGGIGTVYINSKSTITASGTETDLGGTDWVFGFQALAGIEYELSNNLYLSLSYRFLGLTSANFGRPSVNGVRVPDIGNLDVKSKAVYNHSLQFGLRLEF